MSGQVQEPSDPEDLRGKFRQRNAAATAFVGILIGLAYQEAVAPVRTAIRASGITFVTGSMFLMFFLVGLAAFIASYYSLILGSFERLGWLLQFALHALSSVVLVFMGGVASAEASADARYGFVDLLFLHALIGSAWSVATLASLSRAQRSYLAPHTIASVVSFLVILGVQLVAEDRYAALPIAVLTAVAVLHFLATVVIFRSQDLL